MKNEKLTGETTHERYLRMARFRLRASAKALVEARRRLEAAEEGLEVSAAYVADLTGEAVDVMPALAEWED